MRGVVGEPLYALEDRGLAFCRLRSQTLFELEVQLNLGQRLGVVVLGEEPTYRGASVWEATHLAGLARCRRLDFALLPAARPEEDLVGRD
jgi:hypothetical protein